MITHEGITGVDENTARRILVVARDIAPCLDSLTGENEKDALAVLIGVAAELPASGSRRMRSMSRNGTSISLADVESAFSADDRRGLRALCGMNVAPTGPLGSFPPAGALRNLWPEC